MKPNLPNPPLIEFTRGEIVESIHYGAVAVVDGNGRLAAYYGDPDRVVFLRSAAKPFQALPLIEAGGQEYFGLTPKEIALMCSSHSGTDEHVQAAAGMQAKIGIREKDLMCGVHAPYHQPTAKAMLLRGEEPTQNRHNCSGKHSGMLALAKIRDWPMTNYLDLVHPVQEKILRTFAEMCGTSPGEVKLGTDGCSAPNFAVPLTSAALGLARLADPTGLSAGRENACRTITAAMTAYPEMVAGPERFDTALMKVTKGRVAAKGGAEGYQGLALMPGALGKGSPSLGVAIKITDGDPASRARPAVAVEVLRQLGALNGEELAALEGYGPGGKVRNWRNLVVGEKRTRFTLKV